MMAANNKRHRDELKQREIDDLQHTVDAMQKERADKLEQSRGHLLGQLRMSAEKYLTVNGYMQARTSIEQAAFGQEIEDAQDLALSLAREMSNLSSSLADAVEKADVETLNDSVLDRLLDKEFCNGSPSLVETVKQLLVVHMLQNVGPSLDDIVGWREKTNADLEAMAAALGKAKKAPSGPVAVPDLVQ